MLNIANNTTASSPAGFGDRFGYSADSANVAVDMHRLRPLLPNSPDDYSSAERTGSAIADSADSSHWAQTCCFEHIRPDRKHPHESPPWTLYLYARYSRRSRSRFAPLY